MSTAPQVVLPGTWGRIDLSTEGTTRTSTRRFVERTVGRDDSLATLRSDLRRNIQSVADTARDGGAVEFHIGREVAPGVPFPAWLSIFLPESSRMPPPETPDVETLNRIVAAVVDTAPDPRGETPETAPTISAARAVSTSVEPATAELPARETLRVDYWVTAAEPTRLALLSFSTPLVAQRERMIVLFDAIVATLRWPAVR